MKKRILSMVLVISTLLSLCCISVYAKAPGVETMSAVDIEEASAVLRGKVTSNSGIKIKEYGFQFVNDGNVSYKKFYAGKDFDYPDPINNDIIEYEMKNLKSNKEYCYQFYAINENGEKTIGKSVYFETEGDNEEPEITKLKSSEGNSFYEGTEVTFSASAEDNNEIDKIYLFIDGEVVAKKSSTSVKYTTDELEAGKYEIAAMAEDKAGNESDVEYLTITVKKKTFSDTPQQGQGQTNPDSSYDVSDSTPPTITILSPTNGATINKDIQDTINYSIKATDNVGVKSIEFYQGGTRYNSSNSDTLSSEFFIYNMNLGRAEFEVVATDTSGNKSTKTFYITITENDKVVNTPITDTTAPQISNISSSAGNEFTIGTSTTLSASISDNALDVAYMYIDGEKVQSSTSSNIKYTTSNLSVGSHTVKVVAYDESENENEQTLRITVKEKEVQAVQLSRPNVTVKDTYLYTGEKLNISWNKVSNADYYTIQDWTNDEYYDDITSTSYNKISFDEPGTYSLSVFARSYNNSVYKQSEPYAFNVTVVEEDDDEDYYTPPSNNNDTSIDDFHKKAYNNASSYGGIKVYVNGSQLYFDVEPEIKNGRTMVPLRAIFEALGADVYWNGSTSTVTAYRDNESVELTIGSYYLYTSNGTKTLDQPGYVTNGRTLVPVRAISEAFNCDVEWYGDKQLVSIVAKDKKYQVISSNGQNYNNSAESIILDVPLFKQNDARWKDVKIGDKTIGAIGCTTTAIAMIYSYNNDNITLPNDMRYKLRYSNNDLLWDSLKNVGLSSKEYNSSVNQSMLSTIYQKLDAGKPVIIGAITNSGDYQHWVVITGYIGSNTTSLSTSDFVVNDPGTQCSETLSEFLANGDKADRTKIKRIIY